MSRPRHDLTGVRFGRLLGVSPAPVHADGIFRWRCRCDCGFVCDVKSGSLVAGHTRSCGCLRSEATGARSAARAIDIKGHRFGRLVAVEAFRGPHGKRFWRCACDCGGSSEVATNHLRIGKAKSCGCLQREHFAAPFHAEQTSRRLVQRRAL